MKKIRNILALLMVVVMLVAVMPMNVFAKDGEPAPGDGTPVVSKEEPGKEEPGKEEPGKEEPGKEEPGKEEPGKEEPKKVVKFTVTFDTNGKGKIDPVEVESGKTVAAPNPAPKAEGFKFEGWFEDDKLTKAYDFETAVTKSITLYAKWSKEKPQPKPETKEYTISKAYTNHGSFTVSKSKAKAGETITVTAKPYSGYAVARVYLKYAGITKNINTYYNGYYYDGRYYGRYNDYNKYLYVYENSSYYLRKYDSYREFLRHEYPSHYRYYEDYDYWTDRYDYDWYDRYDNYYYKYLDDYNRYYSDRYATYEDYLKVYHYPHYRDYYDYRYDYRYHNYRYGYNTSDTFDMPASDVTVYVEFTDAYPYYYDDYYYYRYRRDRKAEEAKAKAEAAKKEEEEAKAKAEAEKLPQIYENKAVISIGSNVLDKVSKNVHTVHQMDAPAYVNGGRVMLPLRYVAEALGLQVSWVPETKTVIIWDLTQRVEIPVKSNRIIVNGITYTSDVKPEIKNERTMLPIANIARALGLIDGSDIIWDQYNKQVTLTRKVLSK
ncbi:hypothetical protein HMPREF2800_04085 [Anaerosphaera sp. HMSC064C01]|nr:hypothetical protein HMPREF2800_04085 [Anaerosphaera sp. HMSC064C01]